MRHLPGVGVVAVKRLAFVAQVKLVLVAGLDLGYVGGPVAVVFMTERGFLRVPLIKSADYAHRLSIGSPHTKGGARGVKHRAHAGLQVRNWGGGG